jgi:hypothetical protein
MGGTALASPLPSDRCRSIVIVVITLSSSRCPHRHRQRHCCCSHRCRRHCCPRHLCHCCHPFCHPCCRRHYRCCCCRHCCCHRQHCCFVVVVLVVLLGGQSKEFNQSKPRRYYPWHVDGVTALGLAIGWPTALLGQHLVHDVVLSEIS